MIGKNLFIATAWMLALDGVAAATPQEIFNAAQAAYENGDWQAASDGFDQTLKSPKLAKSASAAIHSRQAGALRHLGMADRATKEAEKAIALYKDLGVARSGDLAMAHFTIAELKRGQFDLAGAITAYREAIATTDGGGGDPVLRWARTGIGYAALTFDPAAAREALDAVMSDKAAFAALDKGPRSSILALRSLAELNGGDTKGAAKWVESALDLAGRETTTVTLEQTRIRSDAALIYARLGNVEQVHKYLAYSGAGHLPNQGAITPAILRLPQCDEEVLPTDVAVIEFAIGSDGTAAGATPIYASRPGVIGKLFAESVMQWHWSPIAVSKLKTFWRASVRMELRCVKRPPPIQAADAFQQTTEEWLADLTSPAMLANPTPEDIEAARNKNAAATKVATDLLTLQGTRGATADLMNRKDVVRIAATLPDEMASAGAPIDAQAYAAFVAASATATIAEMAQGGFLTVKAAELAPAVERFQARPGAARAAAWLRLERAIALERESRFGEAREQMTIVTQVPESALSADDPVRTLAVLHLAMLNRRAGDTASATRTLEDAKIAPEQCSLLDVQPLLASGRLSSSDFPTDALRWGFEGYAREAFDIAPDGRVEDVRTIIAYPPFVFGAATEKGVSRFRYQPPTLGGQTLGCSEQTHSVNYRISGK